MDKELLELVRTLPCIACYLEPAGQAHHVTTRGAGGDDVATNLMPLCPADHSLWHQDPGRFIRAFPSVRRWLVLACRQDVLDRYRIRG